MATQILLDHPFIKEQVKHTDVDHWNGHIFSNASENKWEIFPFNQKQVILTKVIQFFELVYPLLISNLHVVLIPVLATEEYRRVLPTVADPTLVAAAAHPSGLWIDREVRVLTVCVVEYKFWVTKFTRYHERLHRRKMPTETSLHAALDVLLFVFEVANLDSICDSGSCIFIGLEHFWLFSAVGIVLSRRLVLSSLFLKASWLISGITLLGFRLKTRECVAFELVRIKFSRNSGDIAGLVHRFDTEDHQHINFQSFGDVIVW